MVCPLLKVINPLSRLLTGDFTYQREIGSNSHSVSGLCWHGWEQPSVLFLFRLLGSRAVGHGPRAHWMGRWGRRRRCFHAAGQLRQAAFHRHRHWGGERFHGFLEPRRGFLLDCRHPETRVFWECSVQSRLFAGIAPWLHGSLLTLVILVRWMELSPCMKRLCRIFYSTFLLYNIWEMWRFCFMTLLLISVTTTSDSLDWVWLAEGQLRSSWHGSRRYEGRRSLSLRCLKYWSRVLFLDFVCHWADLVSR